MLTRGKVIVLIFLFSTIIWINVYDKYKNSNSLIKWIYIPLYLITILAIYAIICISINLYNFNNIPNGHEELLKELSHIKNELEKKNFTFD
ncbi:dolichol-phosphate mannosyltransferase subunit 3, putative [Plasmodium gallinaceum]|uniref:Dolichol-phosphate mannosyltransferase subunit 3 n=1 Tax=Plasmodium gallinaceum TaxID=5849 RepID=A0A1J1GZ36_PLAGA|nr:dolichol-phosphate mannosyltransferase subunit 3, putative [Plasmodium gallinaceum]CRG96569.1 dolichol-phosphate mannosyltransferase subunit 3, putative [Plasmodium gallinaceum]